MNTFFEGRYGEKVQLAGLAVLLLLGLFLALLSVGELKGFRYIGAGINATNTITISGKGEVFAAPDIATFSYTVDEKAATVAAAQESATTKTNAILAYLKEEGVKDKDIQTSGYNVYPEYRYESQVCTSFGCPPSRQILDGYHVSQSVTVKVRDLENAGTLLSGVGENGATSVSGLTFTIDEEEKVIAEAREKAIEDARGKAEELSKQLRVKMVHVVNFSESGNYPVPIYGYGRGGAVEVQDAKSTPPAIPTGENQIVSNVSVTYEIR